MKKGRIDETRRIIILVEEEEEESTPLFPPFVSKISRTMDAPSSWKCAAATGRACPAGSMDFAAVEQKAEWRDERRRGEGWGEREKRE